jgi:Lipase maturation factor
LRFDRRVLGVFRALLGMVLVYDLVRRFPDAARLWSSDGVLSSAALNKVPQAPHQFSFLLSLASSSSVQLAFAGLGLVFLLYGLGLFTRLMQPLALLGYCSLNARNLFFEDGGTCLVILLLTWTVLLPLGDRYSLDALRRDAALPTLKARASARAQARKPLFTLAALAILLQAAVIYWFNAAHKTGGTWRAGDAVHLVLWQHRVNTPMAVWFAGHEPSWFSPLSTWLTKRTELVLPLLLLWPSHPARSRSLAFVLAVFLHGGIALSLTLGPFSYAMICLLWLAIPGQTLDFIAGLRRPVLVRSWRRVARYRARAVRSLRRWRLASGTWSQAVPLLWRGRLVQLREALLVGMLLVEGGSVLASNRAVPAFLRVTPRPWLELYKPYLRGYQGWSMFAPDAPREDGMMVVDAVTVGGRHIDPFTGQAPNWQQIRDGLVPHSIALCDYLFAMRDPRQSRYRTDLHRYLKKLPAKSPADRLRSAEFWWVSYVPPPRGSYEPGPIRRQRLWRVKL